MKNRIAFISGLCIFALLMVFIGIRQNSLPKNGVIVNGHTLYWAAGSYMSMDLTYEFVYKGERKESDKPINKIRGLRVFENKYFPVFYDPNLGQSQILIDPADFKKFNVPFPDSLSWVLSYFK